MAQAKLVQRIGGQTKTRGPNETKILGLLWLLVSWTIFHMMRSEACPKGGLKIS